MQIPVLPELPPEPERISPADLKILAAPLVREIATELCGVPNRAMSNAQRLRFGRRGSLSVDLRAGRAGCWHDHETGNGGSIIDIAARQLGMTFPEACDWIAWRCRVGDTPPDADELARRRAEQDALVAAEDAERAAQRAARIERAWGIWEASSPPEGTLVQTYLEARRCWHPWLANGYAIRFNPACPMDDRGVYHCMIAAMRDALTGEFAGINRTHLLLSGTGVGARGKRMLGTAKNAVVRLRDEPGQVACFAEGIETTLSTPALIGVTTPKVIATLSAGTMRTMPLMPGIKTAQIMADMDDAGLTAAAYMAARYGNAGMAWTIHLPPDGYADANDALTGKKESPRKARAQETFGKETHT
ncbi:MAG: toprim domain-containing protein [Hyphomicrobiales bacterium]|nr:toprim domain-containing protein [Hyphomicrobiales bacterium]